jgi:hypothetical protein
MDGMDSRIGCYKKLKLARTHFPEWICLTDGVGRAQPFQSAAIPHDQQLAGCGRLRKSF